MLSRQLNLPFMQLNNGKNHTPIANLRLKTPGTPKLMPKWLGLLTITGRKKTLWLIDWLCPNPFAFMTFFHVSLLKKYHGAARQQQQPFSFLENGRRILPGRTIVTHRVREVTTRKATKHRSKVTKPVVEYLIKWEGYDDDQNTWEPESSLLEDYEKEKKKRSPSIATRTWFISPFSPTLNVYVYKRLNR